MFSGIIQKIASVEKIERNPDSSGRIFLRFEGTLGEELVQGESIAVNGVCLSLENSRETKEGFSVSFSVLSETFSRTNLSGLNTGSKVNLERALKYGDRIGGHFVSGHIDGMASVLSMKKIGRDWKLILSCEEELLAGIVFKGSIAVNGVSLTVAELNENNFSVLLIPLTIEHTNLKFLKSGNLVNLELDMIGKYVMRYLEKSSRKKIDMDFLKDAGF